MKYALFYKNQRISKYHPHKLTAIIEAFEAGIVCTGYRLGLFMPEGYKVISYG